jgi:ATP-dependent Clp protease ATP-binding subunit ClpA
MPTAAVNQPNHQQLDHFANDVQAIITDGQTLADEHKHKEIQPIHLLHASMKSESIIKTFKELNLSQKEVETKIDAILSDMPASSKEEEAYFSLTLEKLISNLEKDSSTSDLVHIEKFFAALISKSCKPNYSIFQQCGIDAVLFCEKLKEMRKNGFAQISNERLLNMEAEIGQRVIGQKEAVHAVSRVVRRSKVGLGDPGKPPSMMFLGGSGTGKTELAKALSHFLYGSEKHLIRFDMAEFGQSHQVARLLGSPIGYQGSEDGGQLTNAVRDNPNAIILLDEVEKSHQTIWDIFLSVLDDGRLTDSRGRTVDFSNTIIIMTSNIGARHILSFNADSRNENNEETKEALKEILQQEMLQFLKPELINRLDDVIRFDPLSKMEISQVVEIQLRSVAKLLQSKEMTIKFDQHAKDAIAMLGYDRTMGARPIKRLILKYIKDPIAEKILGGAYTVGSEIKVSHDGERFQLN